ncbi:MAG: hypothetical protein L6R41_004491 [Letrouitia leprolyta]|nr:MAG: hypothetical protein L6R41_004491 [Letrouitia leprolyta]
MPGERRSNDPPTELFPRCDDHVAGVYSVLKDAAKLMSTQRLQSRPDLIQATNIFNYWEMLWRLDQSPAKSEFLEFCRGTMEAYCHLDRTSPKHSSFSVFDLDFIVAARLQWALPYKSIAHIRQNVRLQKPCMASNPSLLPEIIKPFWQPEIIDAANVREAFKSFPEHHELKMKWGRIILRAGPWYGRYDGYKKLVSRAYDMCMMKTKRKEGNAEEVD